MSFPTYPAYKDSGVKWLSDVPEHWVVRRNKQVFRLVSVQVGNKSADFQLLSLTLRGVIPRDMESGKGKFPAEFDTYQVVEPDDIVFCLFDIDETPRTVGISSDFGMITGAYTVAKTLPAADPRFIYYYYFSIDLRKGLRPFYTGLRKVVRPETFLNIELPLPPLSEQATICNFLDHETTRIDALIEEQQRLIELLKEKRQAVISHAVTKGLDPTVPMKDSGVEWLGEVPAHWGVAAVKRYCDVRDGTHSTPEYVERSEFSFPLVTSKDISSEGISLIDTSHISADDHHEISKRSRVAKGDILMPMIGTIGGAVVVNLDEQFSIKNIALFKKGAFSSSWLAYLLDSDVALVQFELNKSGGVQGFVSLGTLRNLIFPIPSLEEQESIVRFLNERMIELDQLITESFKSIDLMLERRSALISAAVTGKIDVRGWQPPASIQAPKLEVAEAS